MRFPKKRMNPLESYCVTPVYATESAEAPQEKTQCSSRLKPSRGENATHRVCIQSDAECIYRQLNG